MQGRQFARVLNERLTERGLARIINERRHITSAKKTGRMTVRAGPPPQVGKKTKMRRKAAKKGSRERPTYLARVKKEFHILICTNDKRYASLRRSFSKKESQTVIVATLVGGIADYLGISAATVTPIVALSLLTFLQVGVNVYCAGKR